jgi:hypothetical protein
LLPTPKEKAELVTRKKTGQATPKHAATFGHCAIYYSFSFSLPPNCDIGALANRLLKAGIANTALAAGDEEVRLAHRYAKEYGSTRLQKAIFAYFGADGYLNKLKWLVTHPVSAPRLMFAVARELYKARQKSDPEDTAEDSSEEELSLHPKDEDSAHARYVLAALNHIDRQYYRSSYIDESPYIRLELRSLNVTAPIFDSVEEVLPFLLLHRSGTAILTLAIAPRDGISTSDLISASRSSDVAFEEIVIADVIPIFEPYPSYVEAAEYAGEEEGCGWTRIRWAAPLPLQAVFHLYQGAIFDVAKGEPDMGEWMCYTSVIVRQLRCCGSAPQWLANHKSELVGLVERENSYATLRDEVVERVVDLNVSRHINQITFHRPTNTFVQDWVFGQDSDRPPFVDDHWSIALVENVLLQFGQLQILDHLITTAPRNIKSLAQAQRQIVMGLDEYKRGASVYMTAQDLVRDMSRSLGLDRTYGGIIQRLEILNNISSTQLARAVAKRNSLLAGIAAATAVLFGLPAIDQSMGLLNKNWPGSFEASPLKIYLVMLGVILVVVAASQIWRALPPVPQKKRKTRLGVRWPKQLTVEDERDDEPDVERLPYPLN